MKLLAIDPGLKGGLAVFDDDRLVATDRMPIYWDRMNFTMTRRRRVDLETLRNVIQQHDIEGIVTEYQTAMPGQSSVATATTFLNWGMILGLRLFAPVFVVHPRAWKRHFDLGPHKAAAIYHARLIYPGLKVTVPDGIAEAVLIGHYWMVAGAEKARLKAAKPRPKRRRKAKPRLVGRPSASSREQGSGSSSGTDRA